MSDPQRPRVEPPAIEPISDTAWSRVERGVWARLDQEGLGQSTRERAHRRWWLALPVAAAAIAGVVLVVRAPDERVRDIGPTRVVSEASPSNVSLADAHIALDPQSAIVMDSHGDAPTVLIERGAAWFAVEPRGSRPPFEVLAGDTRVRVIGTRFRVARSAEHVEVEVDHGIVEIGFRGEHVRVTNHQHWSSDAPGEVKAEQIADVKPELATQDPAEEPKVEPQIEPKVEPKPMPGPTAAPVTPSVKKPVDKDAARFAELARLEPTSPEAAMKGYLALSQGSGRWAEVSLYAAARLASDRHDPRATMLLQIYLKRFPSGANVADARQLLDRLPGGSK